VPKKSLFLQKDCVIDCWHRADRSSGDYDAWCQHWRNDKGKIL